VMSELLIERDDLEAAESHLARGAELGRWSGRLDAVRNAAPALTRLRLARDDASGALVAVEEAEAALGKPLHPVAMAGLLALKARVLVWQGSLTEAGMCARESIRLAGGDRGKVGDSATLVASRVLVAEGKPGEAIAQLTRALAAAEGSGRFGTAIEARILRGLAHLRRGDTRQAEEDLAGALALAEPEGYVRVFVDEGEPVAELLRRLAARAGESSRFSAGYVAALLAAFGDTRESSRSDTSPSRGATVPPSGTGRGGREERPGRSPALVEPLSEREREVLGLMAEGLTNEQIATRLIIALGTVKAHVHNISGKLGAQNRAHAVARAKELGLL
jgi:ATP/maltotriose-dependent transcriptional regulator MalT